MILFHLSFDPVDRFELRVPQYRCALEDSSTPRICLSERLDRALYAIPQGGSAAQKLLEFGAVAAPVLHLYLCDTAEDPDGFLPPETLEERFNVFDAAYSREWWALKVPTFVHQIVRLTSIKVRRKKDPFGKEVVLVDDIQYRFCSGLPQNAPERVCKRAIEECGVSVRTLYTALALHAITPEKWGLALKKA